ncbi:MAG: hypothetical protein GSR81_02815 [Desulfurococcales archaeon]|nr:hypothetical protein [Desulfurococcales archaeon]
MRIIARIPVDLNTASRLWPRTSNVLLRRSMRKSASPALMPRTARIV